MLNLTVYLIWIGISYVTIEVYQFVHMNEKKKHLLLLLLRFEGSVLYISFCKILKT